MLVFVRCYAEQVAEGPLPIRLSRVAELAKVHPTTVSDWRANEDYNAWFAEQMRRFTIHAWPVIKAIAARFASQGSIKHMEFIRDLIEPGKPNGPLPPGAPTTIDRAVIINLPIPPNELHSHPVVMGLLERVAATASDAVGG